MICIAKLQVVHKPPPLVPNSLPIADALQRSAPLTHLRQRLQDSNARFDAVRNQLPATLAPHVQPGPVDDEGWSLLAANASVAASINRLSGRRCRW